MMGDMTQVGSLMAAIMFVWAIFRQLFPDEFQRDVRKYVNKVVSYVYPYVEITFNEFQGDTWFERSKAFASIERYLSTNSSTVNYIVVSLRKPSLLTNKSVDVGLIVVFLVVVSISSSTKAKKLKANVVKDCESVVLSMDDYEEVTDEFKGIKVWWTSTKRIPQTRALFSYRGEEENRYYRLTCKREHRDIITKDYVQYVLNEGKAIALKTGQRKLYTNNKSENWYGYKRTMWSHIVFEHPSTFDTLAMDPKKKKDILDDLIMFSNSKDYYKKVGKSWKRGYLLYGPPGSFL